MPPPPLLQATGFEIRHQTLLRQLIVAAAFSSYLLDPDDVVWKLIRQFPYRRAYEHLFFLLATLLIAAAAVLCTWARANSGLPATGSPVVRFPHSLGDLLFAIGIATLAPRWGAVFLIVAETLRLLRLQNYLAMEPRPHVKLAPSGDPAPVWAHAFRREAAKWGILVTMVVFSVTLIDRLAEILALASILVAVMLNLPVFRTRAG